MELIGSIANQGTLQGQINDANGYLTGVITNAGLLGGQVVAERGLKGDKGDKGDQGEKGDAFTYDDFTPEQLAGLKGEKGDKGDTGSQGVQGEKGDPFTYDDFTPEQLASLKGAKGDKGDKGDQGIQGIQGVQGIQGEKGDTGSQGIQGEKGDKGDTGAKGDTGEKGDTGAKGDKGDKGDTGDDGYSPSASVSKSGSVATITITDKNGTTTASVSDGSGVPSGGTSGQVLTKHSATNYDVEWADASGGGAYIVTFTYDNVEDEWSCDKTAQEIYEAYGADKSITAVSTYPDDVGIIFYLDTIRHYYVEEEEHIYIRFIPQQHTDGGSNATIHNLTLELYQDGWVERTYNEVEAVTNTYGISGSSYIITDDGERGGQICARNEDSGASAIIYWSAMDGMSYDESVITFSAEHIKTDQVSPTEDYDVATKEYVDSSVSGISVPTKTSDLTNDSGFISTETDPTVPSWAKQNTKPTYTASEVGALPDTTTIPSKTSDLTNDSGFITGMEILSYGNSTWQNFIDAYNAKKVVYCRASSNSNPASGSQTRLAFMAYVNNATTPTEVEFQYYRSIATHSASQQGDQVFVYKLNKTNGWTVTTREATTKILPSTGLQSSYSNGTLTITAPHDTTKQDTLVSGTNIKTINNTSLLGSGNITVSAEDEIFVCEYGDTTFADALVAYNAGKRLVCHYNDGTNDFFVWLVICDSESTYFWFEVTSGDKRMEFCLDSNGWTRSEYPASAIPIARRISKFNSDARMNSTDMTTGADSELEDFIDGLNITGGITDDDGTWKSVNNYLKYSKRFGCVYIQGVSSGNVTLTAASWNNIGTLPEGYRPTSEIMFTALDRNHLQPLWCSVTTAGVVRLYCDSGQTCSYWLYGGSFPVASQ